MLLLEVTLLNLHLNISQESSSYEVEGAEPPGGLDHFISAANIQDLFNMDIPELTMNMFKCFRDN